MTARILRTEAEYKAALDEAHRLVALDPVAGTAEADELELLALLLSDYEAKHFVFPAADLTPS
jgi:HTH-type transcriptional regulator/antitoxin HigA